VSAVAIGLKLHEDDGSTPAAIDACLSVAWNPLEQRGRGGWMAASKTGA
jgi:hypothetical protein